MSECTLKPSLNNNKKYRYATWDDIFLNHPMVSRAFWRWQLFIDKINTSEMISFWQKAIDSMKKYDDINKKELIQDIKDAAKSMDKARMEWKRHLSIAEILTTKDKYDWDTIAAVNRLETNFVNWWIANYEKYFMSMSNNLWVADIYNNIASNSMKYAFMINDWVNSENINAIVKQYATEYWLDEWQTKRFLADVKWDPLGSGKLYQFMSVLKSAYSFLKYSPVTSQLWWAIMLMSNAVMWTTLYLSKRRWLETLENSNIIDVLYKNYDFMAWEDRAMENLKLTFDADWKNMFNGFIDKVFDYIPNERLKNITKSATLWWTHTLWDIWVQSKIKRLSIAEALSKNWINETNMDAFLKMAEDWKIPEEMLIKLRADAWIAWKNYFTSGNTVTLNRHAFSRWMFINTLQWYVITRADDVRRWVVKAGREFKKWNIKTFWEFFDHLEQNPELKSILNNVLLSAKMWIYFDWIANWDNEESDKVMTYTRNMSDYISSLNTAFWYRLLKAPVEWMWEYVEYNKLTGKSFNLIDWVEVSILKTLSEAFTSIFREWKIINILTDSAIAYLKTWDVWFAASVAGTDYDKIVNGMWRFSLLPWEDTFWQKWIEWSNDFMGRLLFAYPEFNDAMQKSNDLRDISTIESMLSTTKDFTLRLFSYLPLVSSIIRSTKEPTSWFIEDTRKEMQYEIENNPAMKWIWDWKMPPELLDNPDIVENLYKELITHAYYGKQLAWEWKHVVSTYWLWEMEEEVFVANIAKWQWITLDQLQKSITSRWADKSYLVKVIAAAEANEPWASKIILWYLANQWLYKMKWWANSAEISTQAEEEMKKHIVQELYPYTYLADKTSWYKVAREYLSSYRPELYGKLASDSSLMWFVNTLAFNDLLYWTKANEWEIDAQYISNIFNFSSKYIQDDDLRIKFVNHSLSTISNLENATPSQKAMMRTGIFSSNIDYYNRIKKDPIISEAYAKDIAQFENLVRQNDEYINMVWVDWAEKDMSPKAKAQYYASKWKNYTPSKFWDSNNKQMKYIKDKVNQYYKPTERGITYNDMSKYPQEDIKITIPKPNIEGIYYKIYDDVYKATSEDLTKQNPRMYPADKILWMKYDRPSYRKRTAKYTGINIKKSRAKYTSKATRKDLPGG